MVAALLLTTTAVVGATVVGDHRHDAATERSIFDHDGNLAAPMPGLASEVTLAANDDGSSQLTFSMEYAVEHLVDRSAPVGAPASSSTTPGAKADAAVITVGVYPHLANAGPIRLTPAFQQTTLDRELDSTTTRRDYSVRITPAATAQLQSWGFGSGDPTSEAAALEHVDIDVQQMRDFKVVDGEWDWQQGRAYTAADQPVHGADITDDSTITVNNTTGDGLFQSVQTIGGSPIQTATTPLDPSSDFASYVSLSGAPIECIDQGDGSNPQGFSVLNGWDIEEGLAPGIVPPGASVTQQVNADESLGTEALDVIQQWGTVSTQVTLAALGFATPGVKSMASATYQVAMGLAEFSDPVTAALAVPIKAIVELGEAIKSDMTNSCASFANMVNITAAEPFGGISSVTWGDQTNGLWQVYDSASYGGSPVTDNVAMTQTNGIMSYRSGTGLSTVHPWLAQVASTACGTGCAGDTNNVIDLNWVVDDPCPFTADTCAPTASDMASLPEITIPGTDLCGEENALCPTTPAPNSDASEVSTADVGSGAYEVVGEMQPGTPIVGLAAVDDQSVYGGGQDGTLYRFTVDPGSPSSSIDGVVDFGQAITTVTALDGDLVVTLSDGDVYRFDPSSGDADLIGTTDGEVVEAAVETGGLVYLATDSSMFAVLGTWSVDEVAVPWPVADDQGVSSVAAGASYLFVGFEDGVIERCELTACGSTWSELHDDGFSSAANALAAVGNTLYVGLDNGALAQIDGVSGETTMLGEPGTEGLEWGGMATVGGDVYMGGCVGLQSPVSGDILGVVVLTDIVSTGPVFEPQAPYANTCQNPTSSTSHYKGFVADEYAMVATPPTDGHSAMVFASLTISSGTFVYALENTAPFSSTTCLADDGPCPTAQPLSVVPSGAAAPVGSLSALGAPQIETTCGSVPDDAYVAATAAAPVTVAGEQVTDGFTLTPVTSSSDSCTTAFAWNMTNLGSLPYVLWQGNGYAAQDDDAPGLAFVGSGQAALSATSGGTTMGQGDPVPLTTGGSQLSVDVTNAGALVLALTTEPGDASVPVTVTDDTLTSTGQPIPAPAPLLGAAAPASCAVADPTLAATAAALYPLDDTTAVAQDVSGNQNNGVIDSPMGLDVQPGPSAACPGNGALELDGTSTNVTLPASLDPAVRGDALTALAWVYVEDAPDNPRLIANSHTDEDGLGFELALQDGTGPMFSVGLGAGPTTISGSTALTAGEWHMVAGVYGGGALSLYVDGALAASGNADTIGGTTILPADQQVALGYDPAYDGDFLDGRLADVAIVPQALAGTEIAAIHQQVTQATNGSSSSTTTSTTSTSTTSTTVAPSTTSTSTTSTSAAPTTTVPSPTTSTTAPTPTPTCTFVNASMAGQADALWLLADRSTTAADSSGHGNAATIANAAAYDQAPGPATGCAGSGGLLFDGSSTYVTAPTTLDPATTGAALSVVAFVQVADVADGPMVLVANDEPTTSGAGFSLALTGSGGAVAGGSFAVATASGVGQAQWDGSLSPGTWHQVVGTYDGSTVAVYVDGAEVASTPASGSVVAGAQPVSLGYDPVAVASFYGGLMADVAVVDQALDSGQVSGMWAASQRYANAPSSSPSTGAVAIWALPVIGLGLVADRRRRGGVRRRPGR